METEDSDITLGPGKLLGLFFMLVAVCGVFFAIGYSLGKTSARELAMNDKTALNASLWAGSVGDPSVAKPSAVIAAKSESQETTSDEQPAAKSQPDMTFYNAVKQSDRGSQAGSTDGTQPASPKAPQAQAADPRVVKSPPPLDVKAVPE